MNNLLNGQSDLNVNSLRGYKKKTLLKKDPIIVTKLKTHILDEIILPLIKNNWLHINNNFFQLNLLRNKLDTFLNKYKSDDLILYKDILDLVEIATHEHNQLFDLEKEKYSSNKETTSFIYKTKVIRLKAEYEIYNLIYGKPNKNEYYDNNKLNLIKKLLQTDNITYEQIKNNLDNI